MNGILNVLKPPGMTSHDVVDYIRRLTGIRKVGHTGTLDPAAAGVLPVCLGQATRIIRFLQDDKEYRVEVTFGVITTTGDGEGEIIERRDASALSGQSVKAVLSHFKGEIEQAPPMTSAVHYKGKRLYELARTGQVVERKPRRVNIYSLRLTHLVEWGTGTPRAFLDVVCSTGTYIRTLCMDMGQRLGCGAYMSFLLRVRAGVFVLSKTRTLEEVLALNKSGELESSLVSMNEALGHLKAVQVKTGAIPAVQSGNRLFPAGLIDFAEPELPGGQLVRVCSGQCLLAVARVENDSTEYFFQPVVVLAGSDKLSTSPHN